MVNARVRCSLNSSYNLGIDFMDSIIERGTRETPIIGYKRVSRILDSSNSVHLFRLAYNLVEVKKTVATLDYLYAARSGNYEG